MGILYENKITLTKDAFYESVKAAYDRPFTIIAIIWAVVLVLTALLEFSIGNYFYFFILILLTIFILFYKNILYMIYSNNHFKQNVLLNGGHFMQETISFAEKIHITSSNKSESFFDYSQITRIYETKHLVILKISRTLNVILDKSNFTIGEIENFEKFISSKCPSARFIHR